MHMPHTTATPSVVSANSSYVYFPPTCDFADPRSIKFKLGNNTIVAPDNSTVVSGCNAPLPVQEWLALGKDKDTTVINSMPTSQDLMHMAWHVLFSNRVHDVHV